MEEQKKEKRGGVAYPSQITALDKQISSIVTLLQESTNLLPVLRREFRGEGLQQYPDESYAYIQMSKPMFIKTNPETEEPVMIKVKYKDAAGEQYEKEVYVPNDEAIEEVLSMLKSMGLNQITTLTNIDENTILDDLKEFECKLAAVLCLKQKRWGMDKELLPMIMCKIKTIVQDARYMACNGNTIKAIQKTVQRIEHSQEGIPTSKIKTPYA